MARIQTVFVKVHLANLDRQRQPSRLQAEPPSGSPHLAKLSATGRSAWPQQLPEEPGDIGDPGQRKNRAVRASENGIGKAEKYSCAYKTAHTQENREVNVTAVRSPGACEFRLQSDRCHRLANLTTARSSGYRAG